MKKVIQPADKLSLLAVAMAFGAAGVYWLTASQAATLNAVSEAESGQIGNNVTASVQSDQNASAGKYVQFSGPRPPAQVLNLSNWYLTLPTGTDSADTVKQPQLNSYQSAFFKLNDAGDAVVFTAPVDGGTTSNSEHTRSELRETAPDGTLPWGWPAATGTHTMSTTEAITHVPGGNGVLGFAQIHGPDATWYLILLATGNPDGSATLSVKDETGKADKQVIDRHYVLGSKFDLKISVTNGTVAIDYNGVRKVTTTSDLADSYFKIGAYNQSEGDYGQTEVYSLTVSHQ